MSGNTPFLTPGSTISGPGIGGDPTMLTTSACPLAMAQRYVKEAKEDNQENFAFIFLSKTNLALFLTSTGFVSSVPESLLITNLCGRM